MAGFNHAGRRGQHSNDSVAASRRKSGRAGRKTGRSSAATGRAPALARASAASGLESLESRLLMSAVRPDASFSLSNLGIGDEKSFPTSGTTGVSLGFSSAINFFGASYNGVFVNNNGNVSLGARNSFYSDVDLTTLSARVIAPFYVNVDTRFSGATVRYGQGSVDGHAAFGVNWLNVDYFPSTTGRTNHDSFQLVLIDRSDLGAGNFDMEFNYDSITWESGQNSGGDFNGLGGDTARVGWTANNGDPNAVFQLAGSNVAGAFLDGNLVSGLVHNSFMSDVAGRYVYRFRSGTWADAPATAVNHDPVVTLPGTQTLVEAANGSAYLPLDLAGSFADADNDVWTATVDYGDGWGPQTVDLSGHNFALNHTYFNSGSYSVTVTVDDGHGGVGVGTMGVNVEDHSAPVVDLVLPGSINENEPATLSVSLARDPDASEPYSYEWTGSGTSDGFSFNFLAQDNGQYTVGVRVTDRSGNSTYVEVPVTVNNVAPTATGLSGADLVAPGELYTVSLDGVTDASPVDYDAGLMISFDFDGDGAFDVTGPVTSAAHVYDVSGTYNVRARVWDKDGGFTDYAKLLTVVNYPPVSTGLTHSGDVAEGGTVTFTFGPATDSPADLAAGLTYSFDLDGDGLYEVVGRSNSLSHLYDDNGTYVVHGHVADVHGAYSEYLTTVHVSNVAPTATLLAPSLGDEGQALSFSLGGAHDASGRDTAAGLTYSFDFDGDGVYEVSGSSSSVSHVFDDNGAYTVRARVSDKDGGSSSYSSLVTVRNVAPRHGVLLDNNVIKEGSAVTVWFEGQDDPSHADTLAGFTYSYDFNGDGVYEVSGTSPSATHVFGDNGVYVVHGRVTDKDGGYTEYTTDVEVANVAPTARGLSASGNLVEGNYVTVRIDGVTDPSAADVAAGLTYSFDLNNDGVFETVGKSNSTTVLVKQDGMYTVRAKVTDKDGGSTTYVATGSVANAAPVLSSVTTNAGNVGQVSAGGQVTLSGSFTDAGVLDKHTAVIDWGDGSTSNGLTVSSNGRGSATGSHKYTQGGVYTVKLTVKDDASTAGVATMTATVYVTGVGLQNGVLNIVGTNGNDNVDLSTDNRGHVKVKSNFASDVLVNSTSVREIRATLGAGRDSLSVAKDVTQPVYLNGTRYVSPKGGGGVGNKLLTIARSLFSDRRVA